MSVRAATDQDRPGIRALLQAASLPTDDLDAASPSFLVAMQADTLGGVIGLQPFGESALLRSLAVAPALRGHGLGRRLVEAAEADARAQGVRQLVLLTMTAERFFAHAGYSLIRRDAAPGAVQQAAEFRALCPASAVCMAKLL